MAITQAWLKELDDRLYQTFTAIDPSGNLKDTRQICRTLLVDCTAEPDKEGSETGQFTPPRVLNGAWDYDMLSGMHPCHFAHLPRQFDAVTEGYFKDVFDRVIDFVSSPAPLRLLATQAKESLECYLSLRGYNVKAARDSDLAAQTTGGNDGMVQYVTLDQMSVLCNRSKRTLERWVTDGKMPHPDIEGGGGKPNEWDWTLVREKLSELADRKMPDRYPVIRTIDG